MFSFLTGSLVIKGLIVGGALLVGCATTYYFKMKDDNRIEEITEEIIKSQTGIDIDLTPDSDEK